MDTVFNAQPQPHEEAIALIQGRKPVAARVFYGLLPELRSRAFTVSGVEGASVLQRIRDSIAGLPAGQTWDDVKAGLVEELSPFLAEGAERRAELLLRTSGFQAFTAATYRTAQEDDDTTHLQYVHGDQAVAPTPSHEALDGLVLPKDDPFWETHTAPWGHIGCVCYVRPMNPDLVAVERARDEGKDAPEDRNVVEGGVADALRNGTLMRGGRRFDVSAPEGKGAFQWHPDDLRLPVGEVLARYDAETQADFTAWARNNYAGPDTTVWNWLNSAPAARRSRAEIRRQDARTIRETERRRAGETANRRAGSKAEPPAAQAPVPAAAAVAEKGSQNAAAEITLGGTNEKPDTRRKSPVADAQGALESSADFTRGGAQAVPDHDATERERAARIEAEQRRLIDWAKAHGKLGGRIPPEDTSGGEHRVHLDARTGRVIKATLPEKQKGYGIALGSFTHGATPAEYLDRIALQNRIFDDDIRLERIVLKGGKPMIVTSQPALAGVPPTQAAIDELMASKGFERFTGGAYYEPKEGLLVYDLLPKNAIEAADGTIYPFDPVIQRITPDFADFLRQNPDRIHNR